MNNRKWPASERSSYFVNLPICVEPGYLKDQRLKTAIISVTRFTYIFYLNPIGFILLYFLNGHRWLRGAKKSKKKKDPQFTFSWNKIWWTSINELILGTYWTEKSRILCLQLRSCIWFCPLQNKSCVWSRSRDIIPIYTLHFRYCSLILRSTS